MEKIYPLSLGDTNVGTVCLERQGLYYVLRCRCNLPGKQMVRLIAKGGNRVDLGILVPMDGGFGLNTRLPVSRLGEGELSFRLSPRHEEPEKTFVPILAEEPFAYLSRLEHAFLTTRSGQRGIVIL